MSTIVLRSVKGSPLTNQEVDSNFTNLNTGKLELGGTFSAGTANGVAYLNGSKVLTTGSALTFDGTNLGVNVAAPYGSAYATIHAFSASGATLRLDRTGAGTSTIQSIETGVAYRDLTLDAANNIFSIVGSEQMRLTSTGLGIGNTSPTEKLDVTGNFKLSGSATLSGGTANGVAYLNGSKVLTTGSALTFDGATLGVNSEINGVTLISTGSSGSATNQNIVLNHSPGGGAYVYTSIQLSGTDMFAGGGNLSSYGGSAIINAPGSSGGVIFKTAGSEQMRLTSTGLGIGQSNPTAKLQVKGGTTISTLAGWNTLSNSMFELANPAVRFGIGYDSSDQVLLQAFDSSNAARSLALQVYGGNVGIGTSSPFSRLEVNSGNGTAPVLSVYATNPAFGAGDVLGTIAFGSNGSGNNIPAATISGINATASSSTNGILAFSTRTSSAVTEKMRLTSTGLGIGTSSPAYKLDVRGNATAGNGTIVTGISYDTQGIVGTFSNHALKFMTNGTPVMTLDTSGNLGIGTSSPTQKLEVAGVVLSKAAGNAGRFDAQDTNSGGAIITVNSAFSGAGAPALQTQTNHPILFAPNNIERMQLDSSGNLGLGVTPSAWGSSTKALQLVNGSQIAFSGAYGALQGNAYYDGANYRYIIGDWATRYQLFAGQHQWFTAPSGTAGNAISFTQAMTLDASGNLGIGTTAPGSKLAIQVAASGSNIKAVDISNATNASLEVLLRTDVSTLNAGGTGNFAFATGGTERARIDSSGNLIQSAPTTPPSLATNGTMVFNLTSNTNLRVSVRGSDGVTRTANITLA